MRSGERTRAANRPASSQSRPPHELSNGHIGQRLSEVGRVSCRVKHSFQLPLHVRLGSSLTSNAVRLTVIRTPLRTDPRADLKRLLRQHHYLACREPNKDFEQTHLRRRIALRTGSGTCGPVAHPPSCAVVGSSRSTAQKIAFFILRGGGASRHE